MQHKVKINVESLHSVGRSYYCFCLEQALANISQARVLVAGDVTDSNHELSRIQALIAAALEVS